MNRPSIWDYIKATLFVIGTNVLAIGTFWYIGSLFACACDHDHSDQIAFMCLMWLMLIMGFLQGFWLRRETAVTAVITGNIFTWTPVLALLFEFITGLYLVMLYALFLPSALALLAANRAMLYKCGRQKGHLFWLAGMLVIFAVLPTCVKWLDGWAHNWR